MPHAILYVRSSDRSVMSNAGTALMGIGSGEGKTKAEDAANAAIASPLLDSPIDKAKGIVFNIIGGNDMSLQEVIHPRNECCCVL